MVLILPDAGNGNKDVDQYRHDAKENWAIFLEDQFAKKVSGAMTLFVLPTEYIWMMKARTPRGFSWGVEHGSMAMLHNAQHADVACVLPAVPINNVRPPEAPDYVGAGMPEVSYGFDPFLPTDVKKNWVSVLARKPYQHSSHAELEQIMGALERINATAAAQDAVGCPFCLDWKVALARGRMRSVVKRVKHEDEAVFRPLGLALSLHLGRRGCCVQVQLPYLIDCCSNAVPEFYFLSIAKYDAESGQIFVPGDAWAKRIHIDRSPGQRVCCGLCECGASTFSMESTLVEPRSVYVPPFLLKKDGDDAEPPKPQKIDDRGVLYGSKKDSAEHEKAQDLLKKHPKKQKQVATAG